VAYKSIIIIIINKQTEKKTMSAINPYRSTTAEKQNHVKKVKNHWKIPTFQNQWFLVWQYLASL